MKKLLLFIIPAAFLFSCNTEIPAEQYRAQAEKQCMKQLTKQFLDEGATESEKEKFCDCYSDWMIGDAETVTMGEMMKKATKAEEMATALENCKTDSGAVIEEQQTDVDTTETETQE